MDPNFFQRDIRVGMRKPTIPTHEILRLSCRVLAEEQILAKIIQL